MDSSVTALKLETQVQNPNAELHATTSKKSFRRPCIIRGRSFKRQSRLVSKLERDFQSLLSLSPTIGSDPKSSRSPNPGFEAQRQCSIQCDEFLGNEIFDGEGGEGESFEFFRGLFEKDEILRGVYVNNSATGNFVCLACGWSGEKSGRIYGGCAGLVQHACTVKKTKKKIGAHRAFGRAVCDVLGWDVNEYLNICESKAVGKFRKLKKKKMSVIYFRSNESYSDVATMCCNTRSPFRQVMRTHRSCNAMDLEKNDYQVDTDNRDESNGYDDIAEKVQELDFNASFSSTCADCNMFQSSKSFERLSHGGNDRSLLQLTSAGRADISYFGALGPSVGQCVEKLKNLHGLSPGSELFNFACNLMRCNESREVFMELEDDMARYSWLEYNYNKDGQNKC